MQTTSHFCRVTIFPASYSCSEHNPSSACQNTNNRTPTQINPICLVDAELQLYVIFWALVEMYLDKMFKWTITYSNWLCSLKNITTALELKVSRRKLCKLLGKHKHVLSPTVWATWSIHPHPHPSVPYKQTLTWFWKYHCTVGAEWESLSARI